MSNDKTADRTNRLPSASCYVAVVRWEYEDQLPLNINNREYKAMFKMSKVDGVRMYPYIDRNGERIYLGAT